MRDWITLLYSRNCNCKATVFQLKKRRILGVGFVEDTPSQINDILFHFKIDLVT